ncbi:protein LURP-one-related 5-like [Canna indica]|uniref:Protein LURP-one-related 5-like n=1 Tax=Canna indica TaxID=4628 RepID=A0AAQ3L1Y3_9LILI|nr:protein LURP-one-related 5-like [Canna indica]
MYRVHPASSKPDDDEAQIPTTAGSGSPSQWTVWKKSSMAFHGTDGFSIYDGKGNLAYRVDNYSRKHKCFEGELLLMDGHGKALISLRPQILSMHDRWSGFRGGDGRPAFSMRRRRSIVLQSCDAVEVFVESPHRGGGAAAPDFRTEGCFRRRSCKIVDREGGEVARISRKEVSNKAVTLGDDVFSLVVQPSVDADLVMAFLVIMDRIC